MKDYLTPLEAADYACVPLADFEALADGVEKVCGLHSEHNLQLLTKSENARKGNRFEAGSACS